MDKDMVLYVLTYYTILYYLALLQRPPALLTERGLRNRYFSITC